MGCLMRNNDADPDNHKETPARENQSLGDFTTQGWWLTILSALAALIGVLSGFIALIRLRLMG